MAEDAWRMRHAYQDSYRAELIHKWRMQRLNETIELVRQTVIMVDRDIADVRAEVEALIHE